SRRRTGPVDATGYNRRMRALGCAIAMAVLAASAPAAELEVRIEPSSPAQGDVAVVFARDARGIRQIDGRLGERTLHFFPHGEGYGAVVGIDPDARPGKVPWRVDVVNAAATARHASGTLVVRAHTFPVQRLTLPTPMVDLSPEAERRAADESARLLAIYRTVT